MADAGRRRFGQLLALYAAQGLPFGFATTFIPLMLAGRTDFSYAKATLIQIAAFPWFLKPLWAPLVDTRHLPGLGRRRSWILPSQALLAISIAAFSRIDFAGSLTTIAAAVALFNLLASLQDTAVDGLAVELLSPAQRGLGNVAQVGGYKLGMLLGGSGLVALGARVGAPAALLSMSLLVALLWLVPWRMSEPPRQRAAQSLEQRPSQALLPMLRHFRQRAWWPSLLFIATVKLGEAAMGGVLKPWLVREAGQTATRAAFVVGVLGGGASLLGSVIGGLLAGRFDRRRLLRILALIQTVGSLVLAVVALSMRDRPSLLTAAIVLQHLCVGLLTPVLFAWLMDLSDPVSGATHYTVLATVELFSRTAGTTLSGPLSDALGAPRLMLLAAVAGALPLLLTGRLRSGFARETVTG